MVSQHPPVPRSLKEKAIIEEVLGHFYTNIPFHKLIGLKIVALTPSLAQIEIRTRPELIGNVSHYRLHGGIIATAIDAAAGLAICAAMIEKFCDENVEQLMHRFARIGTIDLRIDYLRQAQGERYLVTGKILHLGGRVASAQMTFENETGDLVATGAGAYIVS
jgi:uncharacterized protein (TIGR00369 family)